MTSYENTVKVKLDWSPRKRIYVLRQRGSFAIVNSVIEDISFKKQKIKFHISYRRRIEDIEIITSKIYLLLLLTGDKLTHVHGHMTFTKNLKETENIKNLSFSIYNIRGKNDLLCSRFRIKNKKRTGSTLVSYYP